MLLVAITGNTRKGRARVSEGEGKGEGVSAEVQTTKIHACSVFVFAFVSWGIKVSLVRTHRCLTQGCHMYHSTVYMPTSPSNYKDKDLHTTSPLWVYRVRAGSGSGLG